MATTTPPEAHSGEPSNSQHQGNSNNGPIYFSSPTDPEFGFLANDYDFHFCLMDPGTGLQAPAMDFHSVDQFFQWQKAGTFNDYEKGTIIRALKNPAQCISLGRTISNFNSAQWDDERSNIMESGVFAKFWSPHPSCSSFSSQTPDRTLLSKLLATGTRELVFASPTDRTWGIGFTPEEADQNRASWGQNLLGKAIMGAREMIAEWGLLHVAPGNLLHGHEEFMYRTAFIRGLIVWKADGKLEVVRAKCAPGEEVETIEKMVKYGNQELQSPLMGEVMGRLRRDEGVWRGLAEEVG